VAGNSADCFPGLAYRMNNVADYDIPSEMDLALTGGSADLYTNSSTTGNNFIFKMQELLDNMNAPDGDGVVFYMNEATKRRIELNIRVMGIGAGFDITQDSYQRPVEKYKNATIRTVGRKSDGVTHIIPDTLSNGVAGDAGKCSHIYAVRYGTGYVQGWQSGPFKPQYLGLSKENGIMHNVVFDWGVGLWVPHVRSIGRMKVSVSA
jgi:hypothetical protein